MAKSLGTKYTDAKVDGTPAQHIRALKELAALAGQPLDRVAARCVSRRQWGRDMRTAIIAVAGTPFTLATLIKLVGMKHAWTVEEVRRIRGDRRLNMAA